MLDSLITLLTNLPDVNLAQVQMQVDLPRAHLWDLRGILRMVFMAVGAITLVVVTLGGFKYVFSQGDPQAAAKAKNTILYGLIGMVVVIMAVTIVNFVAIRLI